jgi:geranylgeranyl diphosphate synthase type I
MEMNFVQIPDIVESQYLQMISLKTAALIEKSMFIGATYAEADPSLFKLISDYAINLGMAFQIKDDYLGSYGDEEKTGKPVDGDIKDGKKTMLLLRALAQANPSQRTFLKSTVGKEGITATEVNRVREIFKETNAIEYCDDLVTNHTRHALAALDGLENAMDSTRLDIFRELARYNVIREK